MRFSVLIICFIIAIAGCASNVQSTSISHAISSGPIGEPVRDVSGFGIVTQVSPMDRVINIRHAPIPEMNWPPMLMSFNVVNTVDLKHFKRADKVQFVLEVDKDENYRIKAISIKRN